MLLPGGATPIRPITGRPSLAPSSSARCRFDAPYETPTRRDGNGFTTFRRCAAGGLGHASSPVVLHLRAVSSEHHNLTTYLLVQARSRSRPAAGTTIAVLRAAPLACHHYRRLSA